MMKIARVGRVYTVTTVTLLVLFVVTMWCFDVSRVSVSVRSVCVAVWAISGVLLAVAQIVFFVAAWQAKHYIVLAFTGALLLAMGAFVYALSMMPS